MEKYKKQKPQFVIILAGGALLLTFLLFFSLRSSTESGGVPPIGEERTNPGSPVRLTIPHLNIDAVVESVGLASDGAMGVPKDPATVAWFELGSRPGEEGSAVIAGHYGWKDGIPAVFDTLSALQKGDKIYIEDEMGTTTVFVVSELRIYGAYEDASDVFSSNDGKAHLNLVTCKGSWNKNSKSYAKRLVVFTDKE